MSIPNMSNLLSDLSTLSTRIKNIANSTIKIQVEAGLTVQAKSFLKKLQSIDTRVATRINNLIRASAFATGGYPKAGQVYIANENGVGSELIGQIGSRHAVANQDQIGDAIFKYMDAHGSNDENIDYNLMASAMVTAMKAAGLGATYLDGRMLAESINRETQRRGSPAVVF